MESFLLLLFLLLCGVEAARAEAMVTGYVICDQCKDGQLTLFDYPLSGAKVAISCPGSDGQMSTLEETSTNWFGNYAVRLSGRPDLRSCTAQVVPDAASSCRAAAGPGRGLKLFFNFFNIEMYSVDLLLSQPARPMSFCQNSGGSDGGGGGSDNATPSPPPSACPYQWWLSPEYRCHWKVVVPETKVALAFGLPAAIRYGAEMNLWEGLHGRGDLYMTLLREATAALLNSFNSKQFQYSTAAVKLHMTSALLGSSHDALLTALSFRRANSRSAGSCNFTPCSAH